MFCKQLTMVWLLYLVVCVLQLCLPGAESLQAIKCSEWYLRAPEHGKLQCSYNGEEALVGTVCLLTCDANFAPSDETMTCRMDGSWHPTKTPTCNPDGSLTVIVVPAVVGTIVLLFVVGFIYAQMSKRCQTSMRSHEDVDVEEGGGGGYVRPGKEFAEAHKTSEESYAEDVHHNQVVKEKKRPKKKPKKFGGKMAGKFRIGVPRGLLRRKLRGLKPRWRSSGPKRVVGRPDGVGESSVCGDADWQEGFSESSAPETSSSSEEEAMKSSLSEEEEIVEKIKKEEIIREDLKKTPSSKTKKIPPPRPPAPKVKKSSRSSDPNRKPPKNASSGYSSDDAHHKKKKKRKARHSESKQEKDGNSKKKGNDVNPYDNYPVAGSDRQYLDFENDYRKNEHIFEGGAYHPQYHPIKTFPIKPAQKKKEESEKDRKKSKDRSKRKSKEDREDGKDNSATGGVKYYSIKQDRDEIRRHKRRSKSRRDRSRERRKDSKKRDKDHERKKTRDHKDRDRSRHKRTASEKRKRHESSRKKKDRDGRKDRDKNEEDSRRKRKKSSRPRDSSEKHKSHRKTRKTSDED